MNKKSNNNSHKINLKIHMITSNYCYLFIVLFEFFESFLNFTIYCFHPRVTSTERISGAKLVSL